MANGERPDRRQWREEGGERVAAVGERRWCVSTEDIRRVPQQDHPYEIRGSLEGAEEYFPFSIHNSFIRA